VFDLTELWRNVHGIFAVLAVAALVHPAVALRERSRPSTRWAAAAATALTLLTFAGGWLLYPGYRADPKPELLREARWLAMLFETKEHLAYTVLALALAGAALTFAGTGPNAVRTARWCYGLAAGVGGLVAALGTAVGAWT